MSEDLDALCTTCGHPLGMHAPRGGICEADLYGDDECLCMNFDLGPW